jgi:hypothetical protein
MIFQSFAVLSYFSGTSPIRATTALWFVAAVIRSIGIKMFPLKYAFTVCMFDHLPFGG